MERIKYVVIDVKFIELDAKWSKIQTTCSYIILINSTYSTEYLSYSPTKHLYNGIQQVRIIELALVHFHQNNNCLIYSTLLYTLSMLQNSWYWFVVYEL